MTATLAPMFCKVAATAASIRNDAVSKVGANAASIDSVPVARNGGLQRGLLARAPCAGSLRGLLRARVPMSGRERRGAARGGQAQSGTVRSARMNSQSSAARNANTVPVTTAAVQPKVAAVNGTSSALTNAAELPPVFITPQAAPALRPPMPMPAAQYAASVTWLARKLAARQATAR